jgi:two-component system, response regulator
MLLPIDIDILLVEDDSIDAELTTFAIGRISGKLKVFAVEDGEEALSCLLGVPGEHLPGMVFLDLKIPKIDGFEVLTRLRQAEATRNLPVVVFSSLDEPYIRDRSLAVGASEFRTKPFKPDAFRLAIAETIGRWLPGANLF